MQRTVSFFVAIGPSSRPNPDSISFLLLAMEGPELHRFFTIITHLISKLPGERADSLVLVCGDFRKILVALCHLYKLIPAYARVRLCNSFQLFADVLSSLQHYVEAGLESPEYVPVCLINPAPPRETTCLRDLTRNFDSREVWAEIKAGLECLHVHADCFQHIAMKDLFFDTAGFGSDVLLVRKGDKRFRSRR